MATPGASSSPRNSGPSTTDRQQSAGTQTCHRPTTISGNAQEMTDRERKLVVWVEQQYGPGIWPEMLAKLRNTMSSWSSSRHVWEFADHDWHFACVWGSESRVTQATLYTDRHEGGGWWPALISNQSRWWVQTDCKPALCKPLIDGGCRRPFITHISRIVVLPIQVGPEWQLLSGGSVFSSGSIGSISSGPSSVSRVSDGTSDALLSGRWQLLSGGSGPPSLSNVTSDAALSGPPSEAPEEEWEVIE